MGGFFSFDQLHELWNFWEVRSIVLFSLFLQSFLILVSPFRTKTANGIISVLLWLAYLLADAAAIFAVGLISHSHVDTSADKTNGGLLAFWAPILIIHLGGPDTITALALEDNELWKRHLLQLLSQLAATIYILYKSLTRDSELLAPTLLVLFAGLIKYGERVHSLYLASADKLRDVLSRFKRVVEFDEFMRELLIEEIEVRDAGIRDIEMVQDAYKWFRVFRNLAADSVYSNPEWQKTREYFRKRNAEEAFRVVAIELNFIYQVLYTKMSVIRSRVGYIFRLVCFVLELVSFFLWHSIHKSHILPNDVKITYALLGGAITLDVVAFFMLIFSDFSIANVTLVPVVKSKRRTRRLVTSCRYQLKRLINRYLAISDRRYWSGYSERDTTIVRKLLPQIFCFWRSNSAAEARGAEGEERTIPLLVIASRIFCRRWSESVQQFNLIHYCVNARSEPVEKVCGWVGLTDFLDRVQYVSVRWFSESLRDSIFKELKQKSEHMEKPEDAHKICEARGEWVLENKLSSFFINWKVLNPWLTDVDYDESLILWHIATEICYNRDMDEEEGHGEDTCQQKHPGSRHQEKNEIEQQKGPETDREEEEDGEQRKGTKTDLEVEDDAEKQKGLASLEKDQDDVEQQIGSSEIQEYQENAAKQQEADETMEEEKGRHVMQQESTPAANEKDDVERQQNNPAKGKVSQQKIDRQVAKTLSDYMLYLFILQPKIMTTVAGRFRFKATCHQIYDVATRPLDMQKDEKQRVRRACSNLVGLSREALAEEPEEYLGISSLFEGCRLAKELGKLRDDKWMVIHKVWVEMLCYAATHCSGNTHAAQLSKGGQLITFVWLLMVHLGLGKQFQMKTSSHARPMLNVIQTQYMIEWENGQPYFMEPCTPTPATIV